MCTVSLFSVFASPHDYYRKEYFSLVIFIFEAADVYSSGKKMILWIISSYYICWLTMLNRRSPHKQVHSCFYRVFFLNSTKFMLYLLMPSVYQQSFFFTVYVIVSLFSLSISMGTVWSEWFSLSLGSSLWLCDLHALYIQWIAMELAFL